MGLSLKKLLVSSLLWFGLLEAILHMKIQEFDDRPYFKVLKCLRLNVKNWHHVKKWCSLF